MNLFICLFSRVDLASKALHGTGCEVGKHLKPYDIDLESSSFISQLKHCVVECWLLSLKLLSLNRSTFNLNRIDQMTTVKHWK